MRPTSRRPYGLAGLTVAVLAALADVNTVQAADPTVPPGRDPMGVAVALIGPGVDYRRPAVANRLARDGEGEIIAWDFIDNDPAPFTPGQDCTDATTPCDVTRQLLDEAGDSRLVVLKVRDGDTRSTAAAIVFAARSPARIAPLLVANASGSAPDWELVIAAARRFSNMLFVVPAYGPAITVPGFENTPVGNLLVVAPLAADASLSAPEPSLRPAADIAAAPVSTPATGSTLGDREAAERAAVRIAALAARLSAAAPLFGAEELKSRILGIAVSPPAGMAGPPARGGWIAEPQRHYNLK